MPEQEKTRIYEISVWFRSAVDPAADTSALTAIRETLAGAGAKILHETKPIKRRLAYPIAKLHEGTFVIFDIEMRPADTHKINEAFRHGASIIRIGVFEKMAEKQTRPMRSPARLRVDRPIPESPRKDTGPKQEVKMEELEKKLEEILRAN